jgi:hypothetical protein
MISFANIRILKLQKNAAKNYGVLLDCCSSVKWRLQIVSGGDQPYRCEGRLSPMENNSVELLSPWSWVPGNQSPGDILSLGNYVLPYGFLVQHGPEFPGKQVHSGCRDTSWRQGSKVVGVAGLESTNWVRVPRIFCWWTVLIESYCRLQSWPFDLIGHPRLLFRGVRELLGVKSVLTEWRNTPGRPGWYLGVLNLTCIIRLSCSSSRKPCCTWSRASRGLSTPYNSSRLNVFSFLSNIMPSSTYHVSSPSISCLYDSWHLRE